MIEKKTFLFEGEKKLLTSDIIFNSEESTIIFNNFVNNCINEK